MLETLGTAVWPMRVTLSGMALVRIAFYLPEHSINTTYPGFLPLANWPILRLLGGDQFRKFCVVAMIILVATVWVTCWSQEEKARQTRRVEKQ